MTSRTFEPTSRRLRQAQHAGLVPFSGMVCRAAALTGASASVVVAAERLVEGCSTFWQGILARGAPPVTASLARLGSDAASLLLDVCAPVLYVAFVLVWLAGLLQTGGALRRPGASPAGVPGRLPSTSVSRNTATAVFVCATCAGAAALSLHHLPDAANSLLQHQAGLGLIGALALRLLYVSTAACALVALVDWALARRQWLAALRMTASERRQELRLEYGAPEVRAARQRARAEISHSADRDR